MRIKVTGGTRSLGSKESLCASCREGTHVKGVRHSDDYVYCHKTGVWMNEGVTSCSDYDNRSLPSLHDLREQAWVLETNKRRTKAGFISPAEWASRGKTNWDKLDE